MAQQVLGFGLFTIDFRPSKSAHARSSTAIGQISFSLPAAWCYIIHSGHYSAECTVQSRKKLYGNLTDSFIAGVRRTLHHLHIACYTLSPPCRSFVSVHLTRLLFFAYFVFFLAPPTRRQIILLECVVKATEFRRSNATDSYWLHVSDCITFHKLQSCTWKCEGDRAHKKTEPEIKPKREIG